MGKVNGKQKGNSFERLVANTLSDKFKEYLNKEKTFIRNPDSGSMLGGKNQSRMDTHLEEFQKFGDVLTPNAFRYSIECKSYKTPPSVNSIIKQEVKQWDVWLEQATQDSKNANRELLLIIKYNNTEPFVLVDKYINEIDFILRYKQYVCYTLKQFLTLKEEWYFQKDMKND